MDTNKKPRMVTWPNLWAVHKKFPWPFKPLPFIIIFVLVGTGKICFDTMHFLFGLYKKLTTKNENK